MGTITHVSASIESLLTLSDDELGVMFYEPGSAVRTELYERLANGEKKIGSEDCEGFDPVNGCPGHPVPEPGIRHENTIDEKKFKGTPGPWKVGQHPNSRALGKVGVRYFVYAEITDRDIRERDDRFLFQQFLPKESNVDIHNEAFYNAHIIGAAPVLLEALQLLLSAYQDDGITDYHNIDVEANAQSAINKALALNE